MWQAKHSDSTGGFSSELRCHAPNVTVGVPCSLTVHTHKTEICPKPMMSVHSGCKQHYIKQHEIKLLTSVTNKQTAISFFFFFAVAGLT